MASKVNVYILNYSVIGDIGLVDFMYSMAYRKYLSVYCIYCIYTSQNKKRRYQIFHFYFAFIRKRIQIINLEQN